MKKSDDDPSKAIINTSSLVDDMVKSSNVYPNLALGILIITEDKVRICLRENLDLMGKRSLWLAPFTTLLAILLAFVTTDFKAWWGMPAATWQALFVFLGLAMLVWLVISLTYARKSVSIEDIMKELKKESETAVESVGVQTAYFRALERTRGLEDASIADIAEYLRRHQRSMKSQDE